jgi:hypothetical protein
MRCQTANVYQTAAGDGQGYRQVHSRGRRAFRVHGNVRIRRVLSRSFSASQALSRLRFRGTPRVLVRVDSWW